MGTPFSLHTNNQRSQCGYLVFLSGLQAIDLSCHNLLSIGRRLAEFFQSCKQNANFLHTAKSQPGTCSMVFVLKNNFPTALDLADQSPWESPLEFRDFLFGGSLLLAGDWRLDGTGDSICEGHSKYGNHPRSSMMLDPSVRGLTILVWSQ